MDGETSESHQKTWFKSFNSYNTIPLLSASNNPFIVINSELPLLRTRGRKKLWVWVLVFLFFVFYRGKGHIPGNITSAATGITSGWIVNDFTLREQAARAKGEDVWPALVARKGRLRLEKREEGRAKYILQGLHRLCEPFGSSVPWTQRVTVVPPLQISIQRNKNISKEGTTRNSFFQLLKKLNVQCKRDSVFLWKLIKLHPLWFREVLCSHYWSLLCNHKLASVSLPQLLNLASTGVVFIHTSDFCQNYSKLCLLPFTNSFDDWKVVYLHTSVAFGLARVWCILMLF